MGQHDHSWAADMDEVRPLCPDHNPLLAEAGIRCPGDETQVIPAEHDAEQYAVMQENAKAESQLWALRDKMHAMAGDKRERIGRGYQWAMSWGEVGSILSRMAQGEDADDFRHGGRPSQLLAQDSALVARIGELDAREEAMEATWKTVRWTRWYPCLNRDGHIHSSLRGCESILATTQMGWATGLSGMTVEEAIATLGPRLCSKCFPDAPSEWCRSLHDITREQRAAKAAQTAAERAAARAVKELAPADQFASRASGEKVTTVAACKAIIRGAVERRVEVEWNRTPAAAARWHDDESYRSSLARLEDSITEMDADAAQAEGVLVAREAAMPGTGAPAAEIAKMRAAKEKSARREWLG